MTARLSRELLAYIGRGLKDQERDLLQVGLYTVTYVGGTSCPRHRSC